ncbi:MAG: DUF1836 domain-containing protein [Bacillota bacterium]|nr:DUF1836 domain-containing protein [Bacillota bacterium]
MNNSKFNMQNVRKLAEKVTEDNMIAYDDLPNYDLFLSQVTDYLNDKFTGEKYTNNVIQNYIKSEVISKPKDGKKRGYTKEHLAQLALLSYMRPVLTSDEIKKVFNLAFNEINNDEDDIITWKNAYKMFSEIQRQHFKDFFSKQFFDEKQFKNFIEETRISPEHEDRILVFLIVMSLIAQASIIKKVAKEIVDNFAE